ncbi:MAG TPA: cyclic nucleotide-binding domain-containing protein, partial [Paenirhodobacter sp.]
ASRDRSANWWMKAMDLNDEARLLRSVPLFQRIDSSKLRLLAFSSERYSYAPGEIICRQGDDGDSAFVILIGNAEVMVSLPEASGGEMLHKVADLGPNAIVGEMSVLCNRPRSATVRAVTPMEALRIERGVLLNLLQTDPIVMNEVLHVLAERLAVTTEELGRARKVSAGGDA